MPIVSVPRVILGGQPDRYSFHPGSGDFAYGSEPELAKRLDALAKGEKLNIYGISGHRTPARSVAVGGFANDPHTRGEAADIGVNGMLRSSAAQLDEKTLNKYGLTRPFAGAAEVNHIQLLPGFKAPLGGPAGDVITTAKDVAGAAADAPAAIAKATLGLLIGAIGEDGARAALYVLLVFAGLTLAGVGVARATGLRSKVEKTAELALAVRTGGVAGGGAKGAIT